MCRLLVVVASEETDFRMILREAPRSLAQLSREHPHGWGIAVYDSKGGWFVHKHPSCAADDESFHNVSVQKRGELLLAHVRKRTVGPMTLSNTHPFQRGRWLFAHNGTIEHLEPLRHIVSPARMAECDGDTDSELLFAAIVSRLDAVGRTDTEADEVTDRAIAHVVREVCNRSELGATNFVLTDGETVYAHRRGRTLYLLERIPGDAVRTERESLETGAVLETPWSRRRHAILVASERMTDEPWREIEEGTLLRIDRGGAPHWRVLAGAVREG